MKKKMLALLLICTVVFCGSACFQDRGEKLNVGFCRNCYSWFLAPMLEYINDHYSLYFVENEEMLRKELVSGDIDAAVIPYDCYSALDDRDSFTVLSVTAPPNLLLLSSDGRTVTSLSEIDGVELLLPSSLKGSSELAMLHKLQDYYAIHLTETYEDDELFFNKMGEGSFDLVAIAPSQQAIEVIADEGLTVCCDIVSLWENTELFYALPLPAGHLLVISNSALEKQEANVKELMLEAEESLNFTKNKHSKASILIFDTDMCSDMELIKATLPHCKFEFLSGNKMVAAIESSTLLKN